MAYHFSANQFEDQYSPRKLGNWEYPKWYPERPRQRFKSTKFIADNNGCLLEGVKGENPWGNYVGTWDLPRRITREYVKKLVAPPERLVKRWGKKKKDTEPEPEPEAAPPAEKDKTDNEATIQQTDSLQDKICKMCGRPLSKCSCKRLPKSESCHPEEPETCHETLYCVKCNREYCFCDETCCCSG